MMKLFFHIAVLLTLGLSLAVASGGDFDKTVERARAAREEGLPQVVIYDLRKAFESTKDPDERLTAGIELARCLIQSGRAADALEVLADPDMQVSTEVRYWKAEALASAGQHQAAREMFSEIATAPESPLRTEAALGEARMFEAVGDREAARKSLEHVANAPQATAAVRLDLIRLMVATGDFAAASRALETFTPDFPGETEMATYLKGRIALDLGDAARAFELFASLINAANPVVRTGAVIGEVDALMSLDRVPEAETRLESYLNQHPQDQGIAELFAKLDELYAVISDPSSAELRSWARDSENPEFAAQAAFYMARHELRAGRDPQALSGFTRFAQQQTGHPLRAEAIIHAIEMLYEEGQIGQAFEILSLSAELQDQDPAWPKLQFLRAMLNLASGREVVARSLFLNVARRFDGLRIPALENAALSEALAGEKWKPESASTMANEQLEISENAELRKALIIARDSRRDEALVAIINAATNPSVQARAAFSAAELATAQGHVDDARSYYVRVADQPGVTAAQSGAMEVFLADDGSDAALQNVVTLARRYLAEFPESSREWDVRMKLGEVLARSGNYRAAQTEFEQAGRDAADRTLAASALYFAADAAARTMDPAAVERSIELYEEVAQSESPLATRSRLDQAMIYNLLGRHEEALVLLERLAANPENLDIQLAARMKLGDTFFAMGTQNPEKLHDAIRVWEEIASGDVPVSDRNEALTKAATAQEKLGEFDAALSGYYRVIDASESGLPGYFWYYKSGFDAARLLESKGRWEEAIIVYKKLADAGGPRSREAESRVKHLRLENFIWE
jgi:tetratricopeptide (TPR) repeat protein